MDNASGERSASPIFLAIITSGQNDALLDQYGRVGNRRSVVGESQTGLLSSGPGICDSCHELARQPVD